MEPETQWRKGFVKQMTEINYMSIYVHRVRKKTAPLNMSK